MTATRPFVHADKKLSTFVKLEAVIRATFEIVRVVVRLDQRCQPGKLPGTRGAGAACGGCGFARHTTAFDIFYRL